MLLPRVPRRQSRRFQTEHNGCLGPVFNAEKMDHWIATNDLAVDCSEAIRLLVELEPKVEKNE
jgi:hypothetical protein